MSKEREAFNKGLEAGKKISWVASWNEAIEAAAKKCEDIYELGLAEDIRELKK